MKTSLVMQYPAQKGQKVRHVRARMPQDPVDEKAPPGAPSYAETHTARFIPAHTESLARMSLATGRISTSHDVHVVDSVLVGRTRFPAQGLVVKPSPEKTKLIRLRGEDVSILESHDAIVARLVEQLEFAKQARGEFVAEAAGRGEPVKTWDVREGK